LLKIAFMSEKLQDQKQKRENRLLTIGKKLITAGSRTVLLKKYVDKAKEKLFLSEDRRKEVYYEADTNAIGGAEYYVLIFLSCIIATLGLLNNSAAVIIGAMIVAPLMNPVMGMAMGVARGDIILMGRALKTLVLGVAASILIACLTSFLIPNLTDVVNLSEVMSRTSPNILDIGIALAAGAAGAFAMSKKKIASSLAGVAIAVSLMPPLAVNGIGLCLLLKTLKDPSLIQNVSEYFKIFSGSFALCFSNLVAMNIAGIIVFTIFGFGEDYRKRKREIGIHFIVSLVLLAVMTFILTGYYAVSLEEKRIINNVTTILDSEVANLDPLAKIEGTPKIAQEAFRRDNTGKLIRTAQSKAYIEMFYPLYKRADHRITVVQVTILTPFEPDDSYVFKLKALLEEKVGPVDLTLRFVNTTNMNIK